MTELNIRKIAERMAAMVDHVDCDEGCSFHNQQALAADWIRLTAPLGGKFALLESRRSAHGDGPDPIQIPVSAFDVLLQEVRNLTAAREGDSAIASELSQLYSGRMAEAREQLRISEAAREQQAAQLRQVDDSLAAVEMACSDGDYRMAIHGMVGAYVGMDREQQSLEIAGLRDALGAAAQRFRTVAMGTSNDHYMDRGQIRASHDIARMGDDDCRAALAAVPHAPASEGKKV